MTARPLGALALAAFGGVLIGDVLPTESISWLASLGLFLAGMALKRECSWPILALASVAFAAWHATTLQQCAHHPLRRLLEAQTSHSLEICATGRIEKPLRRDLPGSEPGAAWFHAREVGIAGINQLSAGTAVIKLLTGKDVTLPPGEYVIKGTLRLPRAADNPGQFDLRSFELRHGLLAELHARTIECLHEDRWNLTVMLNAAAEKSRDWIKKTLSSGFEDAPDERTVALATIIGGTEAEAGELAKPFRDTGTIHIFAVAGLHVGIVGYILWMLLRTFGVSRSMMLCLLLPLLFAYAFVTGLRPSTVRAAVMAAVFFSGALLDRKSDMLNSLGAAALIILFMDTNQAFSIGFQMSFSVIAAIGVFEPMIRRPFQPMIQPDPFVPKVLLTNWQHQWASLKHSLVGLFTISAAATLGSMPCMIAYFGLATPVGLIANMVLVPLTFLLLFTSVMRLLCGLLHLTFFQSLLGHSSWAFAKSALWSVKLFAALPGAAFNVAPPTAVSHPPVVLTVLHLQRGDAAQHLHVGGKDWLLDCGGTTDFRNVLQPYLQHSGVNKITGVVLSHEDREHVGGLRFLTKEMDVGETMNGDGFRAKISGRKPHKHLSVNDTLIFGQASSAIVLYPAHGIDTRKPDDRSLIMRLQLGGFRILWCNDAGFLTEKALLESCKPEDLRCDIIIRNHHPTDFSMLPEFLDAVKPRMIISSNNAVPEFEKLPASLRQACAQRGIRLLDQEQTGAVALKFWPGRLDVVPFRGDAFALSPPLPLEYRASPSSIPATETSAR